MKAVQRQKGNLPYCRRTKIEKQVEKKNEQQRKSADDVIGNCKFIPKDKFFKWLDSKEVTIIGK